MVRMIFISICLMISLYSHSQSNGYPYDIPEYDFIHYNLNRFQFPGDSLAYMRFLEKYSKLIGRGEGQPSVVHIGGSHLQADIYSERIHLYLQRGRDQQSIQLFSFLYRSLGIMQERGKK